MILNVSLKADVGDEITIISFSVKSKTNEQETTKLVGIQTDMQLSIATGNQPVHIRVLQQVDDTITLPFSFLFLTSGDIYTMN